MFRPCVPGSLSLINHASTQRNTESNESRFTNGSVFVRLTSHQPSGHFSQNKLATSNQSAVLFSQNKSAPAISHQPNEQAELIKNNPAPKVH
jgi:hypothetical protein